MNEFLKGLIEEDNLKTTENGAIAYKSTLDEVYDLFAFGGAYRARTDGEIIRLFSDAYFTNKNLALKCLFYLRDVISGQGERRFFRVAFKWLCHEEAATAIQLYKLVPEYGRWDDLLYAADGTTLEEEIFSFYIETLKREFKDTIAAPSLAAKWAPSINAHSKNSKRLGKMLAGYGKLSEKNYRKMLSNLRARLKVLEIDMSAKNWDNINFSAVPSVANVKYMKAFLANPALADRYKEFLNKDRAEAKINAKALYPYQIVRRILSGGEYGISSNLSLEERKALNETWKSLPDYFRGKEANILCMVDTSGSMTIGNSSNVTPMDIAISLGIYAAERLKGSFHGYYMTFSERPQLIKIVGDNIVDNVKYVRKRAIVENTNLIAALDLLGNTALKSEKAKASMPESLVVISDMEIDCGVSSHYTYNERENGIISDIEATRAKWAEKGIKLPRIVYWNVNARNNTILDRGEGVSLVSGASPSIFEQVVSGVTGKELMLDKLLSNRYKDIEVE